MPGHGPGERTHVQRALVLIFMVGLLALLTSGFAHASTPAIDQAAADARALSDLVDQLSFELEAATEEYNFAKQQYEDTQAAAEQTSVDLAKANEDLLLAQERFGGRLVSIYKLGNVGALDVILGASSFSDLVTFLEGLRLIGEQDADLVGQIGAYKTEKEELEAKLASDLQQQAIYKDQIAAAMQVVEDQLAKQKEALKGKEAQVAQLRKAEAERQARLAAEERARKAFLASRPGKVVALAKQYLGVPYVWGGSSPRGFDCSGLVQYVYAKVGVSLPHSARMQYEYGKPVSRSNLRAGDLVFFFTPIQHVGIYIGNGRMINATGSRVQISDVWPNSFHGARRVL